MNRFTSLVTLLFFVIPVLLKGQEKEVNKTGLVSNSISDRNIEISQVVRNNYKEKDKTLSYNCPNELSFYPIAYSSTMWSIVGNPRTLLWADPNINSVVFSYRMTADPPGSYGTNRIAYSVSDVNGKEGTWSQDIQVYEPLGPGEEYPEAAGRYPQCAIYNPPGNTDPQNAFFSYFIPTLTGDNNDWGGYGYGVNQLLLTDPPEPTQHNVTSSGDYYRTIPNAYTISQQGISMMCDMSYNRQTYEYTGNYIMNRGEFDEDESDYEYEEWLFPVLNEGDLIIDSKVAFAPDGQTGYLLVLGNSFENSLPYTKTHPVLFYTDDGGEYWYTDEIHCQLGGEDGLETVKNFVSDEVLKDLFGDGFNRNEIYYKMGNHADMVVDETGRAHITGLIACADESSWYPQEGAMGTFHIIYNHADNSWDANNLYMNNAFDGAIGGTTEYNRPQISTDMDGHFCFISWIDSDISGVTQNKYPDIFLTAYDPVADQYTGVCNVTFMTHASQQAYFASQSHYVFQEESGDSISFSIPFIYEEINMSNPSAPISFWYIDGVKVNMPNYWMSVDENVSNNYFTVEQNHPNPCKDVTKVSVSLQKQTRLKLSIANMAGEIVYKTKNITVQKGKYEFKVNTDNLPPGIYFYTVSSGYDYITRKMIVM